MKNVLLCLLCLAACGSRAQTRQLAVATYNLRYDNAADTAKGNGWKQRCPHIVQLIRYEDPDLFGTQEGLSNQLQDLMDSLKTYRYTGVGREDGKAKGEHSAIFYQPARLQLLDSGNFWLSPNMSMPEKGWDAALPRICSWGRFRVKATGFVFYCFNLHMDHIGVVARKESARLVLRQIGTIAGRKPAMLMGDFNADQHEAPYQEIQASGLLQDAYEAPARWAATGTFNGFDPQRHSDSRIDHIFLGKAFRAKRYSILNLCYQAADGLHFPSDHFPVTAIVGY